MNPDDVIEAIRKTAQEAEVSIGSLSMETYRGATSCDERLPKIDSVIGAFGTWKKARSAAHKS